MPRGHRTPMPGADLHRADAPRRPRCGSAPARWPRSWPRGWSGFGRTPRSRSPGPPRTRGTPCSWTASRSADTAPPAPGRSCPFRPARPPRPRPRPVRPPPRSGRPPAAGSTRAQTAPAPTAPRPRDPDDPDDPDDPAFPRSDSGAPDLGRHLTVRRLPSPQRRHAHGCASARRGRREATSTRDTARGSVRSRPRAPRPGGVTRGCTSWSPRCFSSRKSRPGC